MLRISLLGGFHIEHDGKSLPPISSTAGRSLLAYLITYRDRQHTRDLLAGTFWPERSESSARKRLSQALWQLHTAFRTTEADETVIEVTPNQVSFTAEPGSYWLDVAEFEKMVDGSSGDSADLGASIQVLETAADLYRGDFLAGFYDDWMLLERDRLSDLYLDALERLVTLHKSRSDYRSALSWGRRIVLEDPVRESAHREVMRLSFLLGQTTEALQQYERCVAILREELAVEPSAQTRGLRDEIVQLRDKGDRPFVPGIDAPLIGDPREVPLVGRSNERTEAVRRIEDTLVGRGGVVLVEGESGIGKTRFLNELVKDAHWRGVNVLWSQADEKTPHRPYHTLGAAFRSGVSGLRARQLAEVMDKTLLVAATRIAPKIFRSFPDPPPTWDLPPDEASATMKRSGGETLVALAELAPHVLFIDDAHWMDADSLEVLKGLLSSDSGSRLLVFLAYRSDEARDREVFWEWIRQIDEASHPERLVLSSLSPEDTRLLVDEVSGAFVAPQVAEGIFYETGGNPLFILETLRTLHEATDQLIDVGRAEDHVDRTTVASGVARVIKRRLSNLDAEARVVLNAAATLGSRFDTNLLTRMSRLEASDSLQGLSQLVQRGIIVEVTDGYEFSHQQMRLVAEESIRSTVRRRLHRDAAIALEAEHPDRIEDLAYHYSAAGMAEEAMHLAWQAGSRAVTLASYETAARFLRQAVDWAREASPPAADFFELLCDLESALDVLGERQEQIESIDLMDPVAAEDPTMRAEAGRRRANVHAQLGDYSKALGIASDALLTAAVSDDIQTQSAVERTIGTIHSLGGSPAKAIPHLQSAVVLCEGRPVEEADVRRALGDVLADLQQYEEALQELGIALSLYQESGDLRGVADVKGLLGILSMEQGQVQEAETLYEQALELARKVGYRRAEAINLGNLANVAYVDGRINAALEWYALTAEAFTSIGDRRGAALARANSASVRHRILGDDDTAEKEARSALEFFESESHEWGRAFCVEILGGITARRGRTIEAVRLLEQARGLVENSRHRWLETHLLREVAEIELARGKIQTGRDLIDQSLELCLELGLADVRPTLEAVASRAALAGDDVEEAIHLARQATKHLTDATDRSYCVWFQRYLAERAVGNEVESENALEDAWRLLEETLSGLSQETRRHALSRVPVNAEIAKSHRRTFPEIVEARLPAEDVPLGRQITDKDTVTVEWTLSDPRDYEIPDRISRRRQRISRLITEAEAQGASPRVADLAAVLAVSEATLRRDLGCLRRAGNAVATRGSP